MEYFQSSWLANRKEQIQFKYKTNYVQSFSLRGSVTNSHMIVNSINKLVETSSNSMLHKSTFRALKACFKTASLSLHKHTTQLDLKI